MHFAVALAVVLACMLWLPGWDGALVTPSAGPMRFVWCQLLLIVLWAYERARRPRLLTLGTALWVVGCLWSAESAVYCSMAWLPAYVWLAWRGEVRAWTAPGALAVVVGGIVAWYLLVLGHPPDPRAFTEYVVAFGRFYSATIGADGPVWILVLVLGLCGTVLWFAASPLTLALTGATWALASYYVGNCNDVTVTNLLGVLVIVLAILGDVALRQPAEHWSTVVRLGVGSLLAVALATDLLARRWLNPAALSASSYLAPVSHKRSWVDERLIALLRDAGMRDGDPVAFLFLLDPGQGLDWTPWLPFGSLVSLMPIYPSRQAEYVARRLARAEPPVAWMVEQLRDGPPSHLREAVAARYRAADVLERAEWRVTRFERIP